MRRRTMQRREFVALLGGAAAASPLAARAQQDGRGRWIGARLQYPDTDPAGRAVIAGFVETLEKLGWTVGRNLAIDYRWGVLDFERARTAIAQILRVPLDAILVQGGPALIAAQQATTTVPIVFTSVSE